MEFYQVINNRRTVRELKSDPVPDEILERIPVGNEGSKVAEVVHAPKNYMLPCYIGLGYPAETASAVKRVERQVKDTLHFGKW